MLNMTCKKWRKLDGFCRWYSIIKFVSVSNFIAQKGGKCVKIDSSFAADSDIDFCCFRSEEKAHYICLNKDQSDRNICIFVVTGPVFSKRIKITFEKHMA